MYELNNGKITIYPSYFIISGEIDDDDFKTFGPSNLNLEVIDNSTDPSTIYNISYEVINSYKKTMN
jgi:hypothetical protein